MNHDLVARVFLRCRQFGFCIGKCIENMHTNVRVLGIDKTHPRVQNSGPGLRHHVQLLHAGGHVTRGS